MSSQSSFSLGPYSDPRPDLALLGELWIVDLEANVLRRFAEPEGDAYQRSDSTATPGLTVIGALPGVAVDLSGLPD